MTNPDIGPGDRLSFTLFLALALHAALILGVTFTQAQNTSYRHTMEVTLAQQRSEHRPERVDFLAQLNQAGSGTLEEKRLQTSPTEAQFQDTEYHETAPIPQQAISRAAEQARMAVTTAAESSNRVILNEEPADQVPSESTSAQEAKLIWPTLDIASLEARLDRQRQVYAKRPRVKRLTSLATAASTDAFYLNSWRRKVENIGNLNYPEEARRRKLYGSLRLLVAILPDGSLEEVRLLESSGHQVLDDAAISIVRLAAPYAPFPDKLRQTTDVLEIIRTWQFRKNASLRSF